MQSIQVEVESSVQDLADEISRYMSEREFVADTIDGISQWWILRQRLHEERRRVEQAMNYLCAQGRVATRTLPNGTVLYSPAGGSDASSVRIFPSVNETDF